MTNDARIRMYGTPGDDEIDVSKDGSFGGFAPLRKATGQFNSKHSDWESFDKAPRQVADVNGDGLADIIGFGPRKVYVALGNANGTFGIGKVATQFFTPTRQVAWGSFDLAPRQVADVNGDGRADIIGFGPSPEAGLLDFTNFAVSVALGQEDGTFGPAQVATRSFASFPGTWGSFDKAPRQVADVNGDGKADIIGFGPNKVSVALGNANGTFGVAREATQFFTTNSGWSSFKTAPRHVADVNGDGKADIIGFSSVFGSVFGSGFGSDFGSKVYVALGQDNGTFGQAKEATEATRHFRTWSDFNINPRQVADVNGDGRADIIGFGENDVSVLFGQEDGTFSTPVQGIRKFTRNFGGWESYERYPRQVADVNGDGQADIIGFGGDHTYVSLSESLVVTGGAGNDTLLGDQRNDTLLGGAGNDSLKGGFGNDSLKGGTGDDTLKGDSGNDSLDGWDGRDRLFGGDGNDTISGGSGRDIFNGGDGRDTLKEEDNKNFRVETLATRSILRWEGQGVETIRSIETVDLTGGESSNILNAKTFTEGDVILSGLGGNDKIWGGAGNDTISGGSGINRLRGGAGNDTFTLDKEGKQVIYDFDRSADTIDVNADVNHIERKDIEIVRDKDNGRTEIKLKGGSASFPDDGPTLAIVEGNSRIDMSDLSGFKDGNNYHPLISVSDAKNLDKVIERWAKNYAVTQGVEYVGGLILGGIELSQGEVTYDWNAEFEEPGDTFRETYTNSTNIEQPGSEIKLTKTDTTETAVTHETQFSLGASLSTGLTTSAKAAGNFIGGSVEAGVETSINFEVTTDFSSSFGETNKTTREESITQTSTFIAPRRSVTVFENTTRVAQYTGSYEYDVTISGNVEFGTKPKDNSNASTTSVKVPVTLILEQYNPDIFYSNSENIDEFGLPDGTQLTYQPQLTFGVTGTLDSTSTYTSRTVLNTTHDVLLNGERRYDALGIDERLWVATGQLPLEGTAPVRINKFSPGQDQIGFSEIDEITGISSLGLSVSRLGNGIISYGEQRLAILPGVDVTNFTAEDFIFDKANTAL